MPGSIPALCSELIEHVAAASCFKSISGTVQGLVEAAIHRCRLYITSPFIRSETAYRKAFGAEEFAHDKIFKRIAHCNRVGYHG